MYKKPVNQPTPSDCLIDAHNCMNELDAAKGDFAANISKWNQISSGSTMDERSQLLYWGTQIKVTYPKLKQELQSLGEKVVKGTADKFTVVRLQKIKNEIVQLTKLCREANAVANAYTLPEAPTNTPIKKPR